MAHSNMVPEDNGNVSVALSLFSEDTLMSGTPFSPVVGTRPLLTHMDGRKVALYRAHIT